MLREVWIEVFPGQPWPGSEKALRALADEIRSLRTLTDTIVTTVLDEQGARRSYDEIQRAHDLVGQYCVEMDDKATFEHVSTLCWVLRHDHNTTFAQILATVEERLERLGIQVVRLADLQHPDQER